MRRDSNGNDGNDGIFAAALRIARRLRPERNAMMPESGATNREDNRNAGVPAGGGVPLRGKSGDGKFWQGKSHRSDGRVTAENYREFDSPYPPDAPHCFERMRRDAQVRACLTTKKRAVLSEEAEIFPADDSESAMNAARFVETTIARLHGGMSGIVSGALEALSFGFALGEYIWNEGGELDAIRWHDPTRFQFHSDPLGNLLEVEVMDAALRLPYDHFVHYTYQSRYGDPYGESDLVAAYRPWSQKDLTQRMWLRALDRFGAPIPVARVPSNWQQDDIDSLSRLLARLQNESSLVLTDDVKLDITLDAGRVEPARAFHTACAWYDGQIARAILGQELTTSGGSGSGSYALGKVHAGVQEDWVQSLRSEIAAVVLTSQIARRVVTQQFGASCPCPVIRFPNRSQA